MVWDKMEQGVAGKKLTYTHITKRDAEKNCNHNYRLSYTRQYLEDMLEVSK